MIERLTSDNQIIFSFQKDIDSGYTSHSRLSKLATRLSEINAIKSLVLDFSNVRFVASNQFAILGCILETFRHKNPDSPVYFYKMNKKIEETIQKNGFCTHFALEKIPDIFNTVIPYTIFGTDEIGEFEKYIMLKVFSRRDLPYMSSELRNNIIDNILEIFNNVKEHTHSHFVYTCGQYFPRSSFLFLTIVDSGETIPYNVDMYFAQNQTAPPDNTLEWAIASGNSTRISETPGGLGLSLLQSFITLNHGKLFIISGKQVYENNGKKERYKNMDFPFPGTIVTVAFNLADTTKYCMNEETVTEIIF